MQSLSTTTSGWGLALAYLDMYCLGLPEVTASGERWTRAAWWQQSTYLADELRRCRHGSAA